MSEYIITSERIEQIKGHIKKHPIDPAFDEVSETFDGEFVPLNQMLSRMYKRVLDKLGESEQ